MHNGLIEFIVFGIIVIQVENSFIDIMKIIPGRKLSSHIMAMIPIFLMQQFQIRITIFYVQETIHMKVKAGMTPELFTLDIIG